MTPEPIPEPENHKIDGDYSTYSNDEIVEEFEWYANETNEKFISGQQHKRHCGA
jgi:hypothetical protein